MASEAAFTRTSDQLCMSDWAVVSLEVDAAPSHVDFAKPKTIIDAKRLCDPVRLNKIVLWPQSLKTQFTLCQGEIEHTLGNFDSARHYFTEVKREGSKSQAARASYRLAEIEEQRIWATSSQGKILRNPELAHQEIITFLSGVREARDAFMQVTSFPDPFWARRAAFRVISIVDDALWEIRNNLYMANLNGRSSPFDFLFGHLIENHALDEQLLNLEQERTLLEQSLIFGLQGSQDDPVLESAILERAKDPLALSPSFSEFIKAPWSDEISALQIVRVQQRYYRRGPNQTVTPLLKNEALKTLRSASADTSKPLPFAFALAYLSDEIEPIPEDTIRFALQSNNAAVQTAGLYAAEAFASHSLTPTIIKLWKDANEQEQNTGTFFQLQNTLYGRRERILLCLARHFSLGRNSTQLILASKDIGDAEKAWLLQFRRDRNSSEFASRFLRHPNPIVRVRTQYALRIWNGQHANAV